MLLQVVQLVTLASSTHIAFTLHRFSYSRLSAFCHSSAFSLINLTSRFLISLLSSSSCSIFVRFLSLIVLKLFLKSEISFSRFSTFWRSISNAWVISWNWVSKRRLASSFSDLSASLVFASVASSSFSATISLKLIWINLFKKQIKKLAYSFSFISFFSCSTLEV